MQDVDLEHILQPRGSSKRIKGWVLGMACLWILGLIPEVSGNIFTQA
jgi:hypothetical protein